MTVYVDVLVSINIFVNYFLLMCVKGILKINVKRSKLILGALAGGVYSLVIFIPEIPEPLIFLMNITASLFIVIISFKPANVKQLVKCFAVFFGVNFAFAGLMLALWLLFSPKGMIYNNSIVYFNIDIKVLTLSTVVCYFIITLITKLSKRSAPDNKIFSITLLNENKSITVNALLDTGNTLRDPFTGKPVIILEKSVVKKLFDVNVLNFFENGELKENFDNKKLRLIPVNTVSSTGMLKAAIIDGVIVNSKNIIIKNVIAAQSETAFKSGEYSALLNNDIINERGINNAENLFKAPNGKN